MLPLSKPSPAAADLAGYEEDEEDTIPLNRLEEYKELYQEKFG